MGIPPVRRILAPVAGIVFPDRVPPFLKTKPFVQVGFSFKNYIWPNQNYFPPLFIPAQTLINPAFYQIRLYFAEIYTWILFDIPEIKPLLLLHYRYLWADQPFYLLQLSFLNFQNREELQHLKPLLILHS